MDEPIVGLRQVHEILRSKKLRSAAVAAFIQHGTLEDGFTYEIVCPYCAKTVGKVSEVKTPEGPEEMSPKELASTAKHFMAAHIHTCTASWSTLAVQKTATPLGTEKIVREM